MLFRFQRETESITLPRKYRPPAARRRKSKRPAPYFVEPVPEDGDVAVSTPEEEATSTTTREATAPVAPAREASAREMPSPRGKSDTPAATKHIARDYSYVRAEVRRIVLVAGFLVVALFIVALLRG
jgi:hypothetical protein